ncbi:hypothetical protein THRCLA_07080 [Thraustotheca clavata]|uniref:PH domain-containing protein n=1 Tax=Thraustotheca clavata TaxID=74557 RepID=A0A1V9ZGQ4_9STRA|nr:hypothetical protein THRCLA_07080 [Thraustotheca clavata]
MDKAYQDHSIPFNQQQREKPARVYDVSMIMENDGASQGLRVDVNAKRKINDEKMKNGFACADTYLNASIQLLQQQSDTRQRIRNLWFLTQRLKWDNHINAHAMELLRTDLLQTMKGLGMEKQDGERVSKKGYLIMLDPIVRHNQPLKVWCTLSEEQCQLEITLPQHSSSSLPFQDAFGLSRLSSSLSWLLNEDQFDHENMSLPLYGAQVHATLAGDMKFRLDILVQKPSAGQGSRSFQFQVENEDEYLSWMTALESVARYDLFQLQASIRHVPNQDDYVRILSSYCPINIPLAWQRNRIAKEEKQTGIQRRDSKNMPMLQVIKDIERDSYVIDGITMTTTDGVNNVIQYLVGRVMEYLQDTDDPAPTVTSPAARMAKATEAKALSFVERILRGSSRTQSGGDIYDAISIVCSNKQLLVCPVSHDALPVQIDITVAPDAFQVNVFVVMHFKIMTQDTSASVADWARLEGTLKRSFTYGLVAQPGSIEIDIISTQE